MVPRHSSPKDIPMAKKNNGLASVLTLLPWWAHILLAAIAYVLVSRVMPAMLGDGTFAPLIAAPLNFLGIIVAAVFILSAGYSFVAARRKRRLLDRQTSLDSIRALSWREFEELVAEAYRRDGYRVLENDQPGPDGGVDIRLRKDGARHLVQCKNWRNRSIGVRIVREIYGVLAAENAQQAVVVCSGGFTQDARQFAYGKPIQLVDGEALLILIQGVQRGDDGVLDPPAPAAAAPVRAPAVCPKCGGRLVERTATRGKNAGNRFLGCETFPRCRHTENLPDE